MALNDDTSAILAEIKRASSAAAISYTDEEAEGLVLKETGRMMFYLQESIELVKEHDPTLPVSQINIYRMSPSNGMVAYLSELNDVIAQIFKSFESMERETVDKIREYLRLYIEAITRLDGVMTGLSIADSLQLNPQPKRIFRRPNGIFGD